VDTLVTLSDIGNAYKLNGLIGQQSAAAKQAQKNQAAAPSTDDDSSAESESSEDSHSRNTAPSHPTKKKQASVGVISGKAPDVGILPLFHSH
jgi:hypothetical protein